MKKSAKKLLAIGLAVVLNASFASPSLAEDASGYLSVSSNTLDSKRGIQRFTFSMSLSDNDGISASYVNCTNNTGKLVFRLTFSRNSMEAYFLNESAAPVIKLQNYKELTSSTSGGYASRMIFDVPIAAIWKRNETCVASTFIEDRRGNLKQVDSDTLTLVNNLLLSNPVSNPNPAPSNSSQAPATPNPNEPCKPEPNSSKVAFVVGFSAPNIRVVMPTWPNLPNCRVSYTVEITGVKSKSLLMKPERLSDIEIELDTSGIFEPIVAIELVRKTISSRPKSSNPSDGLVLDPEKNVLVDSFITRSDKTYLALFGDQQGVSNISQAQAELERNRDAISSTFLWKKFPNCTAMRIVFPNGISKSKTNTKLKAFVSKDGYTQNKKLDRDKDGIACER